MARRKIEDEELKPYVNKYWTLNTPIQIRVLTPDGCCVVSAFVGKLYQVTAVSQALMKALREARWNDSTGLLLWAGCKLPP